jgi:hypothetical protein
MPWFDFWFCPALVMHLRVCISLRRLIQSLPFISYPTLPQATRSFASEAAPVVNKSSGAGIFQRITSFFVGVGLTAIVTQFYIYNEIQDGNKKMISKQKDLENRLAKLEGKK